MKKNRVVVIVIAVLVGVGLIVGWYFSQKGRVTLKPEMGDIAESIYGLGTVTSQDVYHLKTSVVLSVKKIHVQEGQEVKSGDALIDLDGVVMRTPISGTVTSINAKLGELVTPQVSIITVTNLKNLFLEVSLEQQSILRVKKDQSVVISFESLRAEKLSGQVSAVYPRDNQFIVKVTSSQWPSGLLPGMTADVAILVGKKENVLLVPVSGLSAGVVKILRDSKKVTIPIKLGVVDGEWAEVIDSDLNVEDEIIIKK